MGIYLNPGNDAFASILKKDITFYHELASYATSKMKEDVIRALKIFNQ